MPRTGYIVAPPNHGENVFHDPNRGIYSANLLFNKCGTPALEIFYQDATVTDNWEACAELWSLHLQEEIDKINRDVVLIIPNEIVARTRQWTYLGSYRLDYLVWRQSFDNNDEAMLKFRRVWDEVAMYSVRIFWSYKQARKYVRGVAKRFIANPEALIVDDMRITPREW